MMELSFGGGAKANKLDSTQSIIGCVQATLAKKTFQFAITTNVFSHKVTR